MGPSEDEGTGLSCGIVGIPTTLFPAPKKKQICLRFPVSLKRAESITGPEDGALDVVISARIKKGAWPRCRVSPQGAGWMGAGMGEAGREQEAWWSPAWEADYQATLQTDPELATAMLHVHNFSDIAGQIYAGELACMEPEGEEPPADPEESVEDF